MTYVVKIKPRVFKILAKLPHSHFKNIMLRIDALAKDPFPYGYEKMKEYKENIYKFRVGDYRIVYEVIKDELIVSVIYIGNRADVYRLFRKTR